MTPKARHRRRRDTPYRVLTSPGAPADERRDAELEASRRASRNASGLVHPDDLKRVMRWQERLSKAAEPRMRPPGVAKVSLPLDEPLLSRARLSLVRPVGLDFGQLREIVKQDVTLRAIIGTRNAQVQRFLRPSTEEWKPGFNLRFKDRARDVTDDDQARLNWLRQWLMNCGAEFDPRARRRLKRPGLRDFVALHLTDSLTLDAAPIEIVPTASGRPHGFVAVDGGRVFLTESIEGVETLPWAEHVHLPSPGEIQAVLAFEGRAVDVYTYEDLMYPVRRPSTSPAQFGYGQPEAEELLGTVTAFLNAMSLNARGFTHNSIPQGLITLFGDFNDEDIEELKSEWEAYVTGVSNRWRLPILFSQDRESGATYTPVGAQFSEMMFERWMTFLVAIKCALYLIDPEEINFSAFTNKPATLAGSDTEERLASSKDKGLWPLLAWLGDTLNELLYLVDPDVELYWTGLESDQQAKKQEAEKAMLYGEYRQSMGMAATGVDELDNAPMNPSMMGIYNMVLQMRQAQANPAQMDATAMDPAAPQGEEVAQLGPEALSELKRQGIDPRAQKMFSGHQQDIDGDGEAEHGVDLNADGEPDVWHDVDPETGRQQFLDHEGNRWEVADYEPEAPEQPGATVAKAASPLGDPAGPVAPELEVWP